MRTTPRRTRPGDILNDLIQEHGMEPGHYTLFFVTGEGRYLPGIFEIEECSGCVLDDHGRVFSSWLGWDPIAERPAFTEWDEEAPDLAWANVGEYQRARARLAPAPAPA